MTIDNEMESAMTETRFKLPEVGDKVIALCECHKGELVSVTELDRSQFKAENSKGARMSFDLKSYDIDPDDGNPWVYPPDCGKFDYDDEVEVTRYSSSHYGKVGRVRGLTSIQSMVVVKFGEDDWGSYHPQWVRLWDANAPVTTREEAEPRRLASIRRSKWKDERFLGDPTERERELVPQLERIPLEPISADDPDQLVPNMQRFIVDIERVEGKSPYSINHVQGALLIYLNGVDSLSVSER